MAGIILLLFVVEAFVPLLFIGVGIGGLAMLITWRFTNPITIPQGHTLYDLVSVGDFSLSSMTEEGACHIFYNDSKGLEIWPIDFLTILLVPQIWNPKGKKMQRNFPLSQVVELSANGVPVGNAVDNYKFSVEGRTPLQVVNPLLYSKFTQSEILHLIKLKAASSVEEYGANKNADEIVGNQVQLESSVLRSIMTPQGSSPFSVGGLCGISVLSVDLVTKLDPSAIIEERAKQALVDEETETQERREALIQKQGDNNILAAKLATAAKDLVDRQQLAVQKDRAQYEKDFAIEILKGETALSAMGKWKLSVISGGESNPVITLINQALNPPTP